ncbi:hypothetical protein TanjilG_13729 [Lupinus angustifolius]|uniref:Uncharacterized protein n=1 Tax=Lupinus angustifolius TaxID=3871 RepID=A0A394DFK2_LUPAN|nr:PREDICTED: uncharacterized protein LOC109340750 [Lupinus angustifolius]OIW21860.1 hypothetical protein TanjilG_13729 [Lupinus angustifolius]
MCRSTNYYGYDHEVIDPFTFTDSHISLYRHVGFIDKVNDKETKPMVRNKQGMKNLRLEDIPEDEELFCVDNNSYIDDDDDGWVDVNPEVEEALEMDLEVLRRTFDMGIWVVCLGLGYMFSRAKFRPPTFP